MSPFPQRIISLVPSQTELLCDLGLKERVVGITKFCIHPDDVFRSTPRVGGTKNVNLELVRSLNPDLIIANKEENVKEQVKSLTEDFPVWVSDVRDLESALSMIHHVGELTGSSELAHTMTQAISSSFSEVKKSETKAKVLYLIWKDPYMSVGSDTFIHDMLERCGLQNVFEEEKRYPEVHPSVIQSPDLIFLSSEPYPFKESHKAELQKLWPQSQIELVDGEYFSWYGSRLLDAPTYFQQLLEKLQ